MILKLFTFTVKPNHINNFKKIMDNLCRETLKNESPKLYKYTIKENKFIVLEQWDSESDFKKHIASDHLQTFRTLREGMVIAKEEIDFSS